MSAPASGPVSEKDQARFWAKVALPNGNGCMLWLAYVNPDGYGTFRLRGKHCFAHRVSYLLAFGAVPDGLQVDHLCRMRHCVAPEHLEAVTPRENTFRGNTPAAANAAKTHCPQGHPYDEANTYRRPDGPGRGCRACKRQAQRALQERRHADAL